MILILLIYQTQMIKFVTKFELLLWGSCFRAITEQLNMYSWQVLACSNDIHK